MLATDLPEFTKLLADLGEFYDRPVTGNRVRVFFEHLRHVSLFDVKRMVAMHRKSSRKFPQPSDLSPPRANRSPVGPAEPELSKWAQLANKVLWNLQFEGGRGVRPIGKWQNPTNWKHGQLATPLDDTLARVLAAKADYVRMAEEDEALGKAWTEREFVGTVHDGLKVLLIAADKAEIPTESTKL